MKTQIHQKTGNLQDTRHVPENVVLRGLHPKQETSTFNDLSKLQDELADIFFDMWLENKNSEVNCYNIDNYED